MRRFNKNLPSSNARLPNRTKEATTHNRMFTRVKEDDGKKTKQENGIYRYEIKPFLPVL